MTYKQGSVGKKKLTADWKNILKKEALFFASDPCTLFKAYTIRPKF